MSQRYPCPCCGHLTLGEEPPGTFAICSVCAWEDDNVQFNDPSFFGGANAISLNEARANFRLFGARLKEDLADVRPPNREERCPGSVTTTHHAEHKGLKFVVEEDKPEVGAYLYVYEKGKCIRDELQSTIATCKDIAFEDYGVALDQWIVSEADRPTEAE